MGLRGPKVKDWTSISWTPDLAYCIGLLATDGCLINDGRHINFTSGDIQLVKLFRNLLKRKNKICYKTSGTSKRKCPYLQFGDVGFYKWLINVGITPRKSLTIGPLQVPDHFYADFIRGCFDGDGSIYSYMDPRWANSHMFYISIVSCSKSFVQWMREKCNDLFGIKGHISESNLKSGHRLFQLRYAKRESLVLISNMYYNNEVPCLERKRIKINNILEKHNQFIVNPNKITFLKRTLNI